MTPDQSTPSILIIEDSAEDFEILTRALRKNDLVVPMKHCPDGFDAIDYLKGKGAYENDPECTRPAFILLDLNLPGMDGLKITNFIRNDNNLKDIPIIAFTTSRNPMDVEATYKAGVNTYLSKPDDMDGYANIVHVIRTYWFEHTQQQTGNA